MINKPKPRLVCLVYIESFAFEKKTVIVMHSPWKVIEDEN